MPRDAGLSTLGLIFRFPLACAPGGSAPPLEDWWSRHNRLAELELEYGIENSKVDSIRSKLFGALREFYQERDRLRLLVQFRKAFIDRLLSEGEESAERTAVDGVSPWI